MTSDELAVEALTSGAAKGHAGDIELTLQLGQKPFSAFTTDMKVSRVLLVGSDSA